MSASKLEQLDARRTRERLSGERGIILPLSIMILAVILVLALIVATSAVRSNTTAGKQIYADQALATAEAGLQSAYHRMYATQLSGTEVKSTECFTKENAGLASPTEGCAEASKHGTGTVGEFEYTYYNEPLSSANKFKCAGPAYIEPATVVQRCLTATATVHGITRRVQERAIGAPEVVASTFESLGEVSINNKSEIKGPILANGKVQLGGGVKTTGTVTGKEVSCSEKCTKVETLGAVKTPTVESCSAEQCASSYEAAREHNKAEELLEPLKANYKSSERVLNDSATVGSEAAPIELKAGTYNFCEMQFQQNVYLKVPKGTEVKIYIDSLARAGSKCSHYGEVKATNGFCIANENENPAYLKFFMWGDPGNVNQSKFSFTNGVGHCGTKIPALIAEVFAPYSTVEATNGGSYAGKVYAGEIKATNGLNLESLSAGTGNNVFAPTAWTICNRSKVESNPNPASGCY